MHFVLHLNCHWLNIFHSRKRIQKTLYWKMKHIWFLIQAYLLCNEYMFTIVRLFWWCSVCIRFFVFRWWWVCIHFAFTVPYSVMILTSMVQQKSAIKQTLYKMWVSYSGASLHYSLLRCNTECTVGGHQHFRGTWCHYPHSKMQRYKAIPICQYKH